MSTRFVTLFGKRYLWSFTAGRWSLGRVVDREGPSADELWKLIGHTDAGDLVYAAPAGTEPPR